MNQLPITWTTEHLPLSTLVEWERNPVILSEHDAKEIEKSLRKFGLVLPLVANAPLENGTRRLIDGHQRKTILIYAKLADGETLLDVRVPDRLLTEQECDELSIRLRRNTGEFDWDALANFEIPDLLSFGFQSTDFAAHGIYLDENGDLIDQSPPDLDDLADQYGEPNERDFWPVIKVQVSPETEAKYKAVMVMLPGADEAEKFDALVSRGC
jgi:hypothetical protein